MQTSTDLLTQIRKGDVASFNILYNTYWEKLYGFAYKISKGDKPLSEQIVQDIFIYIWERKSELEVNNIEAYLFQAAKFQLFSYYRKQKLDTVYIEDNFEAYVTEATLTEDNPVYELLRNAIEKLPEKRKEILLLSKIQGLNIQEIAEQLNLSPQTVKNQLTAAVKQLKDEFKDVSVLLVLLELYYTL